MPTFHYRAATASGEIVEGDKSASSSAEVARWLQEQGHVPLRAEASSGNYSKPLLAREIVLFKPVSGKDLVLFTREVATLLSAGLTLERTLEVLIEVVKKDAVRKVLSELLEAVRGGAKLSDALAGQSDIFPAHYISLVRAGEAGGNLDQVLTRLADYVERSEAIAQDVRSALLYPCILLVMASLAIAILMTVVIPEFELLFEDAGDALPAATKAVMATANFLEHYWWALLIAVLVTVITLRWQLQRPHVRRIWHGLKLRIPLVGDFERKVEVARFSRTLGTLASNGVTLLDGLRIVRETLDNMVMAEAIETVALRLKEGQSLAAQLSETAGFPELAVHLVRVGEETGSLDSMLLKVADIYDREVQVAVKRMISLLVPLLTIGLGLVIAGIIASVLTALLSLNELAF